MKRVFATVVAGLAIVAGSSGRLPLEQARKPYDCVLTGELKHHDMLAYSAHGIAALLLGHSASERPILPELKRRLAEQLPSLTTLISRADKDPATAI